MAQQVAGKLDTSDGAAEASGSVGNHHPDGSTQEDSFLTRIRSHSKSTTGSSSSLAIHRTSTRESHQSAGSGEGFGSGLSGLISNTRSLFKRHNRSGSLSIPSPTEAPPTSSAVEPAAVEPASNSPAIDSSDRFESRRLPSASASTAKVTTPPTSIQLPPPILPGPPPPLRPAGVAAALSDETRSSSDNNTVTSSSSSSIPRASSSSATTVSDVEHSIEDDHFFQAAYSSTSSSAGPSMARDFALPPGAALMPMTTAARYKALPRLQSYSVTHPEAGPSSSRESEDGDAADYDTTTSQSGTETEHDDESEVEEGEEEEGEEDDDDEHEHDEDDVRGGVAAMRTSMQRPALPTLSSTRGFSRTGNTPGISPTMNTNPFNFSGWTTFASSTPTPGPMRTARPQAGDNTIDGSYFDPRPTSSSSRASTVFQTPAQTPSGDVAPNSGSAGKGRQQSVPIPTPGASISPPSSRIRMDNTRPSSGSPLAAGRRPSAGTFVRSANGQAIPASAIPSVLGHSPHTSSNNATATRSSIAAASNRPSFYQRQSKSLVDLSRSVDSSEPEASVGTAPRSKAGINTSLGLNDHTAADSNESRSSSYVSPSSAAADGSATEVADSQVGQREEQIELDIATAQAELGSSMQSGVVVSPPPPVNPVTQPPNQSAASTSRSRNTSPQRSMQRRQSMPEMRIDPPLYQIDDDFNIQYREGQLPTAREDEGREALPSYTCDVHIEGYVPRKMEFMKPGLQAKDRRWKRQYVILHGTSVKVYKSDPRLKAVPGEEPPPTPGIQTSKHRSSFSSTISKASSATKQSNHPHHRMAQAQRSRAPTESSISSTSSMESEKALMWNQAVQDAIAKKKYDPDMPVHVHLQEEDEHGLASLQHAPSTLLAKASENRCIRHYTLQGAESGLAADYLKRRHVVRVRAEGEQFLIQCKDDRAVIDWIEALQAATNTALDLDVRPLPKFITLPRRRRRRRPADPNAPATATTTAAAAGTGTATPTSTTAQAPSTATRQDSTEVSARSDAMNAMLAEDQDAYLGSNRAALG